MNDTPGSSQDNDAGTSIYRGEDRDNMDDNDGREDQESRSEEEQTPDGARKECNLTVKLSTDIGRVEEFCREDLEHEDEVRLRAGVAVHTVGRDVINIGRSSRRTRRMVKGAKQNKETEAKFIPSNASKVNRSLQTGIPRLTRRLFKYYRASLKMQEELENAAEYLDERRALAQSWYEAALANVAASVNLKPDNLEQTDIDPRVVVLWCRKNDVRIENIYAGPRTLERIRWAIDDVDLKLWIEWVEEGKYLYRNYYW